MRTRMYGGVRGRLTVNRSASYSIGDPTEDRTRDSAVRGRRLDRLTIGPR
jgi:hypothetical protein